jgi:hypothetical protein
MRATCRENLWAFPLRDILQTSNFLRPQSFPLFLRAMAHIELFALELKSAKLLTNNLTFNLPQSPKRQEKSRSTANSSTPEKVPTKQDKQASESRTKNTRFAKIGTAK